MNKKKSVEEEVVQKFYDKDGFEYYPGWKTYCADCFCDIDNPYDMLIPFCPKCEQRRENDRLKGKQLILNFTS